MRTNIEIDDELLGEVMRLGQFKTKREAINAALERFRALEQQKAVATLFGKLRWEGDLDAMRLDKPHGS